jgi:hypothetical protein
VKKRVSECTHPYKRKIERANEDEENVEGGMSLEKVGGMKHNREYRVESGREEKEEKKEGRYISEGRKDYYGFEDT